MADAFVLEAEVFASLPPELWRLDRPSTWARFVLEADSIGSFLEGPCFDRSDRLHVVDVAHGRILRFEPDGGIAPMVEYEGEPNGLALHRDGTLYVADHRRGIVALDPGATEVRTVVDRFRLEPLRGPNDLTFALNGDLYFTDQGQSDLQHRTGRVFRWRDRRLELLLDGLASPNGLALSPDQRTLYLAMTRENTIWRVPLRTDGSIGKVGVHIHLSGAGGPDGMAIDTSGGLAVAHYGLGRVWMFDALGQPLGHVRSPAGRGTTNVAFGTVDRSVLYITEAETASVLRAQLPVAGLPLFSHS